MENNKLNDIINDRLNEYDSSLDLDLEWDAIVNKQARSRKKRWWIFFLFFGIIASSICLYSYIKDPITVSEKEHSELNSQAAYTAMMNVSQSEQSANQQSKVGLSNLLSSTPIVIPQIPTATFDPKIDLDLNFQKPISSTTPATNQEPNSKKSQQIEKQNDLTEKYAIASFQKTPMLNTNTLTTQNVAIDLLPTKLLATLSVAPSPDLDLAEEVKAPIIPAAQKKKSLFSLSLGAGAAISQQTLSARTEFGNSFKQLRGQTETALETYTTDVGIHYNFAKKAFISLGVNYAQAYHKFQYQFEQDKELKISNALLQVIKFPTGDRAFIYGDTTVTVNQEVAVTNFNQTTSWNASLMIGSQLWHHKRFSIAAAGGIEWNMHTQSSGKIISPNTLIEATVSLDENKDVYKKSFGLGLSGTLHLNYQLNRHFDLQLRPTFSYYLNSVTNDDYLLDTQWYRYGLSLGLKYYL